MVMSCSLIQAQRYTIKGKVVGNQSNEKLIYANCVLHYATDTLGIYKAEVSDTNGEFAIKGVRKRDLILEVSYVGYKTFKREIKAEDFKENKIIEIEDIKLSIDGSLQAVEIVSQRKRIEIDDDKMKVNIDEQMASTVDNAFDLLKLVPGVMIDNQEDIKLDGKSGVQFQYNGRQLKMSWSVVKDMLKSMSPDMIEQFEILKNPGVKYDAEGTAGIINIKTKKNQHYGINGSLGAGVGRRDEKTYGYNSSGRLNFVNDKWIVSFGASFRENFSGKEADKDSSRTLMWIDEDTTLFRYANSEYHSKSHGYSSDLSASYSLDSLSTISFSADYSRSKSPFHSNDEDRYILHNPYLVTDSMYNTYNGNKSHSQNVSFSLGYVKQFDSLESKISSDMDFQYNDSYSDNNSEVSYYRTNQPLEDNLLRQQGYNRTNDNKSYNFSWRADLYKPFNKTMKFEAGIKTQYSFDDRDYNSLLKQGGQYVNNQYETNRFKYHENINSLYASFTNKFFDKKLSVRLGVRFEQTNTKGEQTYTDSINTRHYFNFFPSLRLAYKFTDDNEISTNYSYRISRPWSDRLNPFIKKESDYSYSTGNPYLEPQYTHYISLGHSFKYMLFTTLSYSYTNNTINYLSTPLDSTYGFDYNALALINAPINLGTAQAYSLNVSFSKNILMAWYLGIYCGASYNKNESSSLKEKVSRQGWSYDLSVNSFISFPHKFRLNVYYMFYSASYWGISKSSNWQYCWASLGKTFLEDKLSISLSCNWSLNQKSHSKTEYLNYISEYWRSPDYPTFNLMVRYRFGKFYQNKQIKKMQLQDFDSRAGGQNTRG